MEKNENLQHRKVEKWVNKEIKSLHSFVKEFIHEEALEKIELLKNLNKSPTEKFDSLDWFIRNAIFVESNLYDRLLETCYQEFERMSMKSGLKDHSSFLSKEHSSSILSTLKRVLNNSMNNKSDESSLKLIPNYLNIVEIVLLSTFNRDQSAKINLGNLLLSLSLDEESFGKETSNLALSCLSLAV